MSACSVPADDNRTAGTSINQQGKSPLLHCMPLFKHTKSGLTFIALANEIGSSALFVTFQFQYERACQLHMHNALHSYFDMKFIYYVNAYPQMERSLLLVSTL